MGNILRFFLPMWAPRQKQDPQAPTFSQLAFRAATKGDVEQLQSLLEDLQVPGKVPLQQVEEPSTGRMLLHVAMDGGHTQCLRFLLTHGCDLTKGDHSAETPLHAACMGDRLESLQTALTLAKVDVEIQDRWKRTLLLKAMVYNSERVLQFLLSGQVKVNLDAQDSFQLCVVHMAASRNRLDLVRELARQGANLNLLQDRGRSALSLAVSSSTPSMVRELLALGASTCSSSASSLLPCITAIQAFVRRAEGGVVCPRSEEILHIMLAAHGKPLHSDEPNVFQRVLYSADVRRFLPLLHKMMVCSDGLCDDLHVVREPSGRGERSERPRVPLKLFDLARRSARQALMASGRNVLWAVERLSSSLPPAVKGLLLLKDCDFKDFPVLY